MERETPTHVSVTLLFFFRYQIFSFAFPFFNFFFPLFFCTTHETLRVSLPCCVVTEIHFFPFCFTVFDGNEL